MRNTEQRLQRYVDDRLEHWARWSRQRVNLGLGFHTCSAIESYRLQGAVLTRQDGAPVLIEADESAEQIDRLICLLKQYHPAQAKILEQEYFRQGTQGQKAKHLRINQRVFSSQLQFAKHWIAGQLVLIRKWK